MSHPEPLRAEPARTGGVWAIEAEDAGSLYAAAFAALAQHGERAAPRGQETREIGPAALVLHAPARRLAAVYERRLNPFLMLAEVLWILAGRDDVAFVARFSGEITRYRPEGQSTFPDAYGPRLRRAGGVDQLSTVVEMLRRDPDTRRALMNFWLPVVDSAPGAHAVPCNVAVDFKVRDGGLRMTIFNRSNDLHIGLLFNLVQFGIVGELVGARLGVPLMRQTHITTSLHVYTASSIHQRLAATGVHAAALYPHVSGLAVGELDDQMVSEACRRLDDGVEPDPDMALAWCARSPWLSTAVLLLDAHRAFDTGRERDDFTTALDLLDRAPRSDWWVLAAEMFSRRFHRVATPGAASARARLDALTGPLHPDVAAFITAATAGAGSSPNARSDLPHHARTSDAT